MFWTVFGMSLWDLGGALGFGLCFGLLFGFGGLLCFGIIVLVLRGALCFAGFIG